MDLDQIQNMLMQEYGNNTAANDYVSSATAGINNQTRDRVKKLLSKFSTTNMGRSGISGAAQNDIYSNAGQQISQVNAQGEQMTQQNHMQTLSQLLGLSEYQDSKSGFGDILGAISGKLVGSATGGLGAGAGNYLSKQLFG